MTTTDTTTHVWEMIEDFKFAMLTTREGDAWKARPMSHIAKPDERLIYILTERDGDAASHIANEGSVLLTFNNGGSKFLSLYGHAHISAHREVIKRLWNPGAQAFWPMGPDDTTVVAIVIRPDAAEYWDDPNAAVAGVKLAFAVATGTTPDFGENRKTAM